jgi:hypothetical protein
MLGAYHREITPDFAPAERAIAVLNPDEHSWTIVHDAERCSDRRRHRTSKHEGFNAPNRMLQHHASNPSPG